MTSNPSSTVLAVGALVVAVTAVHRWAKGSSARVTLLPDEPAAGFLYGFSLLFASYAFVGGTFTDGSSNARADVLSRTAWFALLGYAAIVLLRRRASRAGDLRRRLRLSAVCLILSQAMSALFSAEHIPSNVLLPALAAVVVATTLPFASEGQAVDAVRRACLVPVVASMAAFLAGSDWAVAGDTRRLPAPVIDGRLTGVMPHPNALGPLAAIALLLTVARPMRWRPFWAALSAVCLWLSDCRTMIFAVPLAIVVVLYRELKLSSALRTALLLLAGGLLVAGVQASGVADQVRSNRDVVTLNGRTNLWALAIDYWQESPVVGAGTRVFNEDFRLSTGLSYAGQAHNQFLSTLASEGLIGVLALVVTLTYLTRLLLKRRSTGSPAGLLVLFVALMLVESPLRAARFSAGLFVFTCVLIVAATADGTENHPNAGLPSGANVSLA